MRSNLRFGVTNKLVARQLDPILVLRLDLLHEPIDNGHGDQHCPYNGDDASCREGNERIARVRWLVSLTNHRYCCVDVVDGRAFLSEEPVDEVHCIVR